MVRNINIGWEFQKLPQEDISKVRKIDEVSWQEDLFAMVDLPHTWYEDGNSYKGTVVYRKKVWLDCTKTQRIFLNFLAADRWCRVYVNGCFAGEHKGGYSAFTFEITKYCERNGENEVAVLLDNRSFDEISPLAGDFTVFGGLYRDVNVIITEACCFDRTYYGTGGVILRSFLAEDGSGKVMVESHLLGDDTIGTAEICYKVYGPDGQLAAEKRTEGGKEEFLSVSAPELWDGKKNPALYHLLGELWVRGETVDTVDITFGFRSISIDGERGFFLNGNHVKIHGVAKHQDYGKVFHATCLSHWTKDMSDILEIGANGVRLSHYQHPQQMYGMCDENGIVVWAEIPMLGLMEKKEVFDNAESQMKELIFQNLHHPSICFWGIQNEIAMFGENDFMYEKMEEMNRLVKSLDSTRISGCANLYTVKNDSKLNRITDAVGYNIYYGWYYGEMEDNLSFVENFHKDNPDIPLGITEYGVDCNPAFHSETPKIKDYTEDYQALYHETVYPIFRSRDYIWGTFIWNLYDFSSEIRREGGISYRNTKGIITMDRKDKKDAFYYYKAQWSKEPFVKIAQERFVNRTSPAVIKVYSNQENVTLTAGGRTYEMCSRDGVFRFKGIVLEMGRNVIRAVSGSYTDEVIFNGVDVQDSSYIYTDPNPGVNVKNWFTDMVEEERMFPKGRMSIRESTDTLVESEEAMKVIEEFSEKLADQMRTRKGSLTLERVLYYMKNDFSDEMCKELNRRLTEVEKVYS